jgi:hypothetical protein
MTDNVAVQTAYAALTLEKIVVSEQTAYAAIIPGLRATITEQTAYVVLTQAASTAKKRRSVIAISS